MSLPTFPLDPKDMTREDVINQIVSSVAMEELGLSHILNAEGEKLQYVLGTLPGSSGLSPTIDELLKVNESVQQTLSTAMQNQMFLQNKMSSAFAAVTEASGGNIGPTGPQGDKGDPGTGGTSAYMFRLCTYNSLYIEPGSNIVFDASPTYDNEIEAGVKYNPSETAFELYTESAYHLTGRVTWDITQIPAGVSDVTFSVVTDRSAVYSYSAAATSGQVTLDAILNVTSPPLSVTVRNDTGARLIYPKNGIIAHVCVHSI